MNESNNEQKNSNLDITQIIKKKKNRIAMVICNTFIIKLLCCMTNG